MGYTYDEPTDGVFDDPLSNVRYLLGDVSPAAPFSLSDGEILFELNAATNIITVAAANVAYKMSGRYAAESITNKSVGNLSIARDFAAAAGRFKVMSREIRSRQNVGMVAAAMFTGGTNLTPQFTLGQHDYR